MPRFNFTTVKHLDKRLKDALLTCLQGEQEMKLKLLRADLPPTTQCQNEQLITALLENGYVRAILAGRLLEEMTRPLDAMEKYAQEQGE